MSALALALALVAPGLAEAQVTNRVFMPDQGATSLPVLDAATNTLIGAGVFVGVGASDAAVTPDGRRAYVTLAGNDSVRIIDVATLTTVGPPISVGTGPFGIAITPNGRKAYVACATEIDIIDLTTNTVTTTIPAADGPWGVAISPDGTRAYVSNESADYVSVIDTTTDAIFMSVTVGDGPQSIAITPDSSTIFVVNSLDSTVSVIVKDPVQDTVSDTITVGDSPWGVAVTPDGTTAYVTNPGDGTVSVIDVASHTQATPILVQAGCGCAGTPTGVSFTPDGRTAYVTSTATGEVDAIDVATATVIDVPIPVGMLPQAIGTGFISPNLIVDNGNGPLTAGSDGDLAARGFGSIVAFMGGTLKATAQWPSNRTLSVLSTGGTIDTNGFLMTVTGDIINDGTLTKIGLGELQLSGTVSNTGGTILAAGSIEILGTHSVPMTITGGLLGGDGTLGTISVTTGAISPGHGAPGIMHASQVTMVGSNSKLVIPINGAALGTGYSQLAVSGTATVGGATLELQCNFAPTSGMTFDILTNVAGGVFAGLPEGGVIACGAKHLRITYHGGVSGSDAMLITDDPPVMSAMPDVHYPANFPIGPLGITVSDDQTNASALILTAVSSNEFLVPHSGLTLGGSAGLRTLTVMPFPDATGTTQITLVLSDGFQITTRVFNLTVDPLPTYYLSEGSTSTFFDTDLLLANPTSQPAPITLTFFRDDATTLIQHRTLAPTSRTTIHVKEIPGLEASSFATTVTSMNAVPLAVERTMWWDKTRYGAHGEKASDGPAPQWYFAEGSQGFFHTYFLLLNLHDVANVAHITYLLEGEAPVTRDYPLPPTSRVTVDVSTEAALANRSFGALVTFDLPGMAERAMYFGEQPFFSGGSDSAGVTTPATSWFLAEGATGSFFDTFVLIANPGDTDATVTMTYLPTSGAPIVKTHALAAHQRLTVNLAGEDPALASAAVGTQIVSTQPVVVERSVYWPHDGWYESHNSAGETTPWKKWALAEGRVGGANHAQTYILLANPGATAANVNAAFLRTDGTVVLKTFTVAPTSRLNIAVTGPGSDVPELADEEFATSIDASQPILVERSMYTDAAGIVWAAGTNATGTRLP